MSIHDYFTPEGARDALLEYQRVVRDWYKWDIGHKIELHDAGRRAWNDGGDREARQAAFGEVYSALRGYWQVFRRAKSFMKEPAAFTLFDELAGAGALELSLTRIAAGQGHPELVNAVERATKLKTTTSAYGSVMAMSKFLHFFNPRAFPIYDNAVIEYQVLRTFASEWNAFAPQLHAPIRLHVGVVYYLKYVLWAASLMQEHGEGVMSAFVTWVKSQPQKPHGITAEALGAFKAAAFEMIIIGAANLEAQRAAAVRSS